MGSTVGVLRGELQTKEWQDQIRHADNEEIMTILCGSIDVDNDDLLMAQVWKELHRG